MFGGSRLWPVAVAGGVATGVAGVGGAFFLGAWSLFALILLAGLFVVLAQPVFGFAGAGRLCFLAPAAVLLGGGFAVALFARAAAGVLVLCSGFLLFAGAACSARSRAATRPR